MPKYTSVFIFVSIFVDGDVIAIVLTISLENAQ